MFPFKNKKPEPVRLGFAVHFQDPPLRPEDSFAYYDIQFVLEKSKEVKRKGLANVEIVLLKEASYMLNELIDKQQKQQKEFEEFMNKSSESTNAAEVKGVTNVG